MNVTTASVLVVRETSGCSLTNSQAAFSARAFATEYTVNSPPEVKASSSVVLIQSVESQKNLRWVVYKASQGKYLRKSKFCLRLDQRHT